MDNFDHWIRTLIGRKKQKLPDGTSFDFSCFSNPSVLKTHLLDSSVRSITRGIFLPCVRFQDKSVKISSFQCNPNMPNKSKFSISNEFPRSLRPSVLRNQELYFFPQNINAKMFISGRHFKIEVSIFIQSNVTSQYRIGHKITTKETFVDLQTHFSPEVKSWFNLSVSSTVRNWQKSFRN